MVYTTFYGPFVVIKKTLILAKAFQEKSNDQKPVFHLIHLFLAFLWEKQ